MQHFALVNDLPMRTLVLNHLLEGHSISGVEAAAIWRCRDLPKRISELRKEGYPIIRERRTDPTGQTYTRYTLNREAMGA